MLAYTNMTSGETSAESQSRPFQIIDPMLLIRDGRRDDIKQAPMYGELAYVPGHGEVFRWRCRGEHGDEFYGYGRPARTARGSHEMLVPAVDEAANLTGRVTHLRGSVRNRPLLYTKSQLELDIEKFSREYPALAPLLKVPALKPQGLFERGEVWFWTPGEATLIGDGWIEWFDRHNAGDFGDVGRYDPTSSADPATVWSAGLQERSVRNSIAIDRAQGVVISRYPTSRPKEAIHVGTCLVRGRAPLTLITITNAEWSLV